MRQIGNLAVVCARRPDVLLQIHGGHAAVHIGAGSDRATLVTAWDNDAEINCFIRELNFGRYADKNGSISHGIPAEKPERQITADRAVNLINRMIDQMVNEEGGHIQPVIDLLLDIGFTVDELIEEFHFSSDDVDECANGPDASEEE